MRRGLAGIEPTPARPNDGAGYARLNLSATAGIPSSTSLAICTQHMAVCLKTLPTNTALMTFATHWYSSAPLRCWICLPNVPWKMLPNVPWKMLKMLEPFPTLCLYVAPAENMVGRVPLIPQACFLAGNSTLTIPHKFSKRRDSGFPFGCADSADVDGRRGSNLYEVNQWLWQFGRRKPCLGGPTVEQTMARKSAVVDQRHKKAVETKRSRKAAPA